MGMPVHPSANHLFMFLCLLSSPDHEEGDQAGYYHQADDQVDHSPVGRWSLRSRRWRRCLSSLGFGGRRRGNRRGRRRRWRSYRSGHYSRFWRWSNRRRRWRRCGLRSRNRSRRGCRSRCRRRCGHRCRSRSRRRCRCRRRLLGQYAEDREVAYLCRNGLGRDIDR